MDKRECVYQKSNGHCIYCGKELDRSSFEVDHFWPTVKGGGNNIENLVPSCGTCNKSKRNRTIEEWRKSITRPNFTHTQMEFFRRNEIDLPDGKPHVFYFELELGWFVEHNNNS